MYTNKTMFIWLDTEIEYVTLFCVPFDSGLISSKDRFRMAGETAQPAPYQLQFRGAWGISTVQNPVVNWFISTEFGISLVHVT